jgi:hypothetical protein
VKAVVEVVVRVEVTVVVEGDVEEGVEDDGGGAGEFGGGLLELGDDEPPGPVTTILAFDPGGTVTTQNVAPPAPGVEQPTPWLTPF